MRLEDYLPSSSFYFYLNLKTRFLSYFYILQALFLENAHADIGVFKHQRESYREQINLEGRNQDRIWVSHVPEEKGGGYVAFAR